MHLLTQMHVASWRLKSLLITELGQHQSVCLLYRVMLSSITCGGSRGVVRAQALHCLHESNQKGLFALLPLSQQSAEVYGGGRCSLTSAACRPYVWWSESCSSLSQHLESWNGHGHVSVVFKLLHAMERARNSCCGFGAGKGR